jgi:hypothetical protein
VAIATMFLFWSTSTCESLEGGAVSSGRLRLAAGGPMQHGQVSTPPTRTS